MKHSIIRINNSRWIVFSLQFVEKYEKCKNIIEDSSECGKK